MFIHASVSRLHINVLHRPIVPYPFSFYIIIITEHVIIKLDMRLVSIRSTLHTCLEYYQPCQYSWKIQTTDQSVSGKICYSHIVRMSHSFTVTHGETVTGVSYWIKWGLTVLKLNYCHKNPYLFCLSRYQHLFSTVSPDNQHRINGDDMFACSDTLGCGQN